MEDKVFGKIKISAINAEFDLVHTHEEASTHQHHAQLSKTYGTWTVSNHYGSICPRGGQWKLENVRLGDRAHLEFDQSNGKEIKHFSYVYTCYAVMMVDTDLNVFYKHGKELRFYSKTDLICRCCVVDDGKRNYVAVFERVE